MAGVYEAKKLSTNNYNVALYGAIGGFIGSYLSHPFDTLKTFQNKFLSENETKTFELYVNKISNKTITIDYNKENSLWFISNMIHIQLRKNFKSNMIFSQKIWKAMCASLIFDEDNLKSFLINNE